MRVEGSWLWNWPQGLYISSRDMLKSHVKKQHSIRAKSMASGARLHLLLFNRHWSIYSTHYLPSAILSAVQILIHLCLATTLPGGYYRQQPPFMWWHWGSERSDNLLKITVDQSHSQDSHSDSLAPESGLLSTLLRYFSWIQVSWFDPRKTT